MVRSTKNKSKILSIALALVMVLTLLPTVAFAADETWDSDDSGAAASSGSAFTVTDTATITIANGASGTLTVPAGYTITIAGTANLGTTQLTIALGTDATVNWTAQVIGTVTTGSGFVDFITITGDGLFNVAPGGSIANTGELARTVYAPAGDDVDVTVSGGTVSANGYDGRAIWAEDGDVTVSGGTVSAVGGAFAAIYAQNGAVKVLGNGSVSINADNHYAIYANQGAVEVSGNGSVSAIGNYSYAIHTHNVGVEVSGHGTVSVTGVMSNAIYSYGDVTVSGNGAVSANSDNGTAITAFGDVTVSGGTVSTDGVNSRAIHTSGGNISVSGTGSVSATGTGSTVYYAPSGTVYYNTNTSLLSVAGQAITAGAEAGTDTDPKTASVTVPYSKTQIANADLVAAANATEVGLYNVGFVTSQSPTALSVGANHIYVKVLAQDAVTDCYYDITVTRQAAPSSGGGGGGSSVETKYTVSFNSNGGSAVSSQSVVKEAKATKPADPSKAGFDFAGWYTDAALTSAYDFNKTVTAGVTLYAKWTEKPVTPVTPAAPGTSPAPEKWVNPFADVTAGDWFYGDVEYVVQNALFSGTGATTFSPNTAMTRGMIVTVLYRLAGGESGELRVENGELFSDVPDGNYYSPAVKWAATNGIVFGVGDKLFAPDTNISRQDLAVILLRYADYAHATFPVKLSYVEFADEAAISAYAQTAVQTLFGGGIVSGKADNLFDPQGDATRAEVASILHRFIEAVR